MSLPDRDQGHRNVQLSSGYSSSTGRKSFNPRLVSAKPLPLRKQSHSKKRQFEWQLEDEAKARRGWTRDKLTALEKQVSLMDVGTLRHCFETDYYDRFGDERLYYNNELVVPEDIDNMEDEYLQAIIDATKAKVAWVRQQLLEEAARREEERLAAEEKAITDKQEQMRKQQAMYEAQREAGRLIREAKGQRRRSSQRRTRGSIGQRDAYWPKSGRRKSSNPRIARGRPAAYRVRKLSARKERKFKWEVVDPGCEGYGIWYPKNQRASASNTPGIRQTTQPTNSPPRIPVPAPRLNKLSGSSNTPKRASASRPTNSPPQIPVPASRLNSPRGSSSPRKGSSSSRKGSSSSRKGSSSPRKGSSSARKGSSSPRKRSSGSTSNSPSLKRNQEASTINHTPARRRLTNTKADTWPIIRNPNPEKTHVSPSTLILNPIPTRKSSRDNKSVGTNNGPKKPIPLPRFNKPGGGPINTTEKGSGSTLKSPTLKRNQEAQTINHTPSVNPRNPAIPSSQQSEKIHTRTQAASSGNQSTTPTRQSDSTQTYTPARSPRRLTNTKALTWPRNKTPGNVYMQIPRRKIGPGNNNVDPPEGYEDDMGGDPNRNPEYYASPQYENIENQNPEYYADPLYENIPDIDPHDNYDDHIYDSLDDTIPYEDPANYREESIDLTDDTDDEEDMMYDPEAVSKFRPQATKKRSPEVVKTLARQAKEGRKDGRVHGSLSQRLATFKPPKLTPARGFPAARIIKGWGFPIA